MFTKKLSKLLINCKSLHSLQRLDPTLTCASHQNSIKYVQRTCKYLYTTLVGHENVSTKEDNVEAEQLLFIKGRKILLNSGIYSNNLSTPLTLRDKIEIDDINQFLTKPWISMSNEELLQNFELLSNYAKQNKKNLMSSEFYGILEVIQSRCPNFSDDELYHLLQCLEFWIIERNDKDFLKFWKNIDNECFKRFRNWSIDKVLMFNDQYYRLSLTRVSEFTYHSLRKLGYKPEKLSRTNLIHYTFLLNVNRRLHLNLYNHEHYIERQIDNISLEELGIFATSITLYQSSIRSSIFLKKVIQKLKKDIDTVSDFTLTKILQILRVIPDKELENELISVLELLETQISTRYLSLLSLFADLQQRILIHNPNLMKKVLDRYEKEINNASVKDLQRIIKTLNKFNYDPKNCKFYSIAMNELLSPHRAEEINKYARLFLNIVFSALQVNFYSEEALKIVLDPEFINKVCNGDKYYLHKEYLFIDTGIELEHPEYSGPRLDQEIFEFLLKRYGAHRLEKIKNYNKRGLLDRTEKEIIDTCMQAFNSLAFKDVLLPLFAKYDVVICKDSNGNVIPTEDKLSQIPTGKIKYAPKDGNKWYALIVTTYNSFTRINLKPIGQLEMHMRYLELMGYIPIVVPFHEWLTVSEDERIPYIRELLTR